MIFTRMAGSWLVLCYGLLPTIWGVALFYRMSLVDQRIGPLVECVGCFSSAVFRADSSLLFGASVLFGLCLLWRNWLPALVCRLLLLAVTVLYLFDIYVFTTFSSRLYISDISRYFDVEVLSGYVRDNLTQIPYGGVFAVALLLAMISFVCFRLSGWPRKALLYCTGLMLLSSAAGLLLKPMSYVHVWTVDNLVTVNRQSGETTAYSEEFSQALERHAADTMPVQCVAGTGLSPNVILLVIESWSSWQSEYFSGLNQWTPRLDEIGRQHYANADFFANGFSTNGGLIALLTGRQPLPAVATSNAPTSFQGFWNLENTLPAALREEGYQSLFLTSGNLAFSSKGTWLENIGFDFIEGHDHPGYRGLKRYLFESVADAALYSRALELAIGDGQVERFRPFWPGPLPDSMAKAKAGNGSEPDLPYDIDLLALLAESDSVNLLHNAQGQFVDGSLHIASLGGDPVLDLSWLKLAGRRDYQMDITLLSPRPTVAQLFYSQKGDEGFGEASSQREYLRRGENTFTWSFNIHQGPGKIRLDPGALKGDYIISELRLRSQPYADGDDGRQKTLKQTDKPYLMVIETVTTHHPYTDPMTMELSAEAAFRYADATAGLFYEALEEGGFFEDGILIITSDHRSMTPLRADELQHFGLSAKARIPLVIAAPLLEKYPEPAGAFQQLDIPASLQQLTVGKNCQSLDQGNLFSHPVQKPACILHHRGDRRDYVDAFCADAEATIQLDGDNTRVVSGETEHEKKLLESINRQRIQGSLDHQRVQQ